MSTVEMARSSLAESLGTAGRVPERAMNSVASLLRVAARLAQADAALLEIAGLPSPLGIFGLSDDAGRDVLEAIRDGRDLPNRRFLVFAAPLPIADQRNPGRLLLLAGAPLKIDERFERALRLFAVEIAHEIDVAKLESRSALRFVDGERIAQIAEGIDALTDAAAIFEAPRIGNVPTYRYVNAAFEQFFGRTVLDVVGQTPDVLYGALTDLDRMDVLHDRLQAGHETRSSVVYYTHAGIPVWVEMNAKPMVEANGASSFFVVTMRDVTARKEFEAAVSAEKRKLRVTLAAIGDAVLTTVGDGRVEFVNTAAHLTLGIDHVDAYGEPIDRIVQLRSVDGDTPIAVLQDGVDDGTGARRGEALRGSGETLQHIAFVASPIGKSDEGFVVVLRDVTAQHRLAMQLSYEASHDALTGLFNRRKFEEVLNEAVTSAQASSSHHSLAFLDLDHFKIINDRCGHAVGDRVLADIAQVLQHELRGRDVLARLGGDEFAVLLQHCSIANARRVLEKLRAAVAAYTIVEGGMSFAVGVSIGVASIEGVHANASAALAAADAACYAAKAAGRNVIVG